MSDTITARCYATEAEDNRVNFLVCVPADLDPTDRASVTYVVAVGLYDDGPEIIERWFRGGDSIDLPCEVSDHLFRILLAAVTAAPLPSGLAWYDGMLVRTA